MVIYFVCKAGFDVRFCVNVVKECKRPADTGGPLAFFYNRTLKRMYVVEFYSPKANWPMLSYTTLAMLNTMMPNVQMAKPIRV